MELIWTETTTVKTFETDLNRRWKPNCFLQAMQQAATHHAATWGYDYETLLVAGQVWILSRVRLHFHDYPVEDEVVSIRTWPRGISRRVFFLRDFELTGDGGRSLAAATSAWLLIDPVSRRILSPRDMARSIPSDDSMQALAEPLDKIGAPADLPQRLSVQAGYSAIDLLGHVTNARYAEWACDSLPFDLYRSHTLRELQINYLHEVRQGECVALHAGEDGGTWTLFGRNLDSGERAFEAVAAFS